MTTLAAIFNVSFFKCRATIWLLPDCAYRFDLMKLVLLVDEHRCRILRVITSISVFQWRSGKLLADGLTAKDAVVLNMAVILAKCMDTL